MIYAMALCLSFYIKLVFCGNGQTEHSGFLGWRLPCVISYIVLKENLGIFKNKASFLLEPCSRLVELGRFFVVCCHATSTVTNVVNFDR